VDWVSDMDPFERPVASGPAVRAGGAGLPAPFGYRTSCSRDEGEGQQARAEKSKSRRGQGEVAIGNEVVISHDTPSDLNARRNLLKLSKRALR
jgi:hypothetical protein